MTTDFQYDGFLDAHPGQEYYHVTLFLVEVRRVGIRQ